MLVLWFWRIYSTSPRRERQTPTGSRDLRFLSITIAVELHED